MHNSCIKSPVIALIPARGGSKGIPNKNLVLLNGRPLVWHTLQAAHASSVVDEIWLSSDDDAILKVGQKFGVRLLKRPAKLSTDEASAAVVVHHFLDHALATMPLHDPLILYLQPTSPLRTCQHIEDAVKLMYRSNAMAVMSVTATKHSPYKSFGITAQGRLKALFDEKLSNARRQELPPTFVPNGAIYAFLASEFRNRDGFPSDGSVPYIMSEDDSVDVDTPDDLDRIRRMTGE